MAIRRLAKYGRDLALSGIVRGGLLPPRGSLTILTYHRVLKDRKDAALHIEPGMYVDQVTFDMHIATLSRHFTIISLTDWLRLSEAAIGKDRYLVITLDDGWLDNYQNAYEVLSARGVPAIIFLVVDAVEQRLRFWTEELADLYFSDSARRILIDCLPDKLADRDSLIRLLGAGAQASGLSRLIAALKALPDAEVWQFIGSVQSRLSSPVRPGAAGREFVNWDEVGEMARSGVITFGSHSMSHLRLDTVDDPDLIRREVVESRRVLADRLGDAYEDVFCYPNGSVGAAAADAVRSAYAAACTTESGCNDATSDSFSLQRIHIHRDISHTPTALLARLAVRGNRAA